MLCPHKAEVKLRCPAGNASDAEKRTLFQDCRASLHTAAVHLSQEAEAQISLLGIMADMQQVGAARFSGPSICFSGGATAPNLVCCCLHIAVLCAILLDLQIFQCLHAAAPSSCLPLCGLDGTAAKDWVAAPYKLGNLTAAITQCGLCAASLGHHTHCMHLPASGSSPAGNRRPPYMMAHTCSAA